jgi:hypothetical protein
MVIEETYHWNDIKRSMLELRSSGFRYHAGRRQRSFRIKEDFKNRSKSSAALLQGLYFLNIARDRLTLSSYSDDGIRERIDKWTDGVPAIKPDFARKRMRR